MTRVHLFHGFNVFDGGKRSIDRLIPYFQDLGYEVVQHNYGWVGPFRLRLINERTVEKTLPKINKGDILVGHSNGCLLCWMLVEEGCKPSSIICIQPALQRETKWFGGVRVLCFHNEKDWIVSVGRIWAKFVSLINPFKEDHKWGSAGRYGFDFQPNVFNVDTMNGSFQATGHSGFFKSSKVTKYWFRAIKLFIGDLK